MISILYRASQQSQNPKERLTDDEVMSSILTFVIAGYETTSLALTWLLRELSIRPAVQDRLRAEIRAAKQQAAEDGKTGLSADDIVALPYLDAVLVSDIYKIALRLKLPAARQSPPEPFRPLVRTASA